MIGDEQIAEKQRRYGYDWHSAYLACLLEQQAHMMAEVLFPSKARKPLMEKPETLRTMTQL